MSNNLIPKGYHFEEFKRSVKRGTEAYIDMAIKAKAAVDSGSTQAELAEASGMSKQAISHLLAVANDPRIAEYSSTILPQSSYSLYLLTTLGDDDFEKMAKPDTTQADILKLKAQAAEAERLKKLWQDESNAHRISKREAEAKLKELAEGKTLIEYVESDAKVTAGLKKKLKEARLQTEAAELALQHARNQAKKDLQAAGDADIHAQHERIVGLEAQEKALREKMERAEHDLSTLGYHEKLVKELSAAVGEIGHILMKYSDTDYRPVPQHLAAEYNRLLTMTTEQMAQAAYDDAMKLM